MIKPVTSTLSTMFATGFGAIGLGTGHIKLSDHACVVVFVVGGVTMATSVATSASVVACLHV